MEFTGQITFTENELFVLIIIVATIGIFHGFFSSTSLITRFDQRRRRRIKKIAIILSCIFIIVPIINVDKFVNPQNMIEIPNEFLTNAEETMEIIMRQGYSGWISLLVPLIVPMASIGSKHKLGVRYFMNVISVFTMVIFGMIMFTDYVPGQIAITLYISFQIGISIGGISGSGIAKYL